VAQVFRRGSRSRWIDVPLNRGSIGKRYGPATFVVNAERVSSFATAVGHPGDGVPPTFVTVPELAAGLSNVIDDAELGLDLAHVLHGDESYEWTRPLERGETVTASATIVDIRGRGGVEFLTLRTEIRAIDGTLVCLATSTLVHREDG
jgi:hypothetical protein